MGRTGALTPLAELVRVAAALARAELLIEYQELGPTLTAAEQVTRMPAATGGGAVDKALRRTVST